MENYQSQISGLLLSDLFDLCYRAHSFISFDPERRAVSYVRDYSQMLADDLAELGDSTGNYKEKFIQKFTAWMSAKSNCMSSMITGPSNFPVKKAQKANNIEHARYEEFMHWRDKYFNAVNRKPRLPFSTDLEEAERKLVELEAYQETVKDLGKLIRKLKTDDEAVIVKEALAQGFSADLLKRLDHYGGKWRVPSFILINNNARIKDTKQKIADLERRITTQENWEDIQFNGGYITASDDRLKIFHEAKPEQEIRDYLKKRGFRWSPHWGCWCRRLTPNALADIRGFIVPRLNQ
ncbi:hypothetical protein [Dyadobacter alkalitolerans]|uniref:hypothetical protein n=1 Tax=Dyadobacter alkalitolerans TaxID=492736 RepID=UPI000426AC1A|nr:hypothetical protein [Dyadobacter alkalitolerans]